MRRILISLSVIVAACSGSEPAGPVPDIGQLPVASITIDIPATVVIGQTAQARVGLLDAYRNPISRSVEFKSSDLRVAMVDSSGVITALAEGVADISVSSEGKIARAVLKVIPAAPAPCEPCVVPIVYDLSRVNDAPLPVKSPWGIGEWDYDSDAGTWMLASATLTLYGDGSFVYYMTHRAASGAMINESTSGLYENAPGSVQLAGRNGGQRVGRIDGSSLTIDWETGLTFTFTRRVAACAPWDYGC